MRLSTLVPAGMLALAAGAASDACALALDLSGSVSIEGRAFPGEPQFEGQSEELQIALSAAPELVWESGNGLRIRLAPFARFDSVDDNRSHIDLRQGYALWRGDRWEFSIGADVLFWGVAESRHLVNIINQIDALEDVNEEAFLGQPMARVSLRRGAEQFSFIVMTGFRERAFGSLDGRLRGALVISDEAQYESEDEQWAPDIAFRYTISSGAFDLGLSAFHGTSREPRLIGAGSGTLTPFYDRISQASADLQWTKDAWLWKLEALVREGQGDVFAAAVAGFEWTSPGIAGGVADLGLLVEYLYDGRGAEAPFTALDDDVFIGSRLGFNDAQDTALLAGAVLDLEGGAQSFRLEFERRIGSSWTLEIAGQAFAHAEATSPEAAFEDDDFLSATLSRHF
ncbi:MAG TPA: hypothetical protein VEA80_05590 [Vitreimonas sp.]|uniref:hypothetical protein n=1 Tax=Vitreimonas sp. TaxID=3069702 RepID=UPI002D4348A7|nr:hypothetical protein [Vitreimonas sp.]HYD86926.1 hypothetical protein [Vitreimonas sp.]